jgi:uncharacterized protein YfbU (UPF0304 family)
MCELNTNSHIPFSDTTSGPIREEKSEWWMLYICPSIRMEISDSRWKHFSRILYLEFLLKFTHISRFGFKSDTNHLLFKWRHIYIYMIGFYNKIRGLCSALRINWQFKHLSFCRRSRILRQFVRLLLDKQYTCFAEYSHTQHHSVYECILWNKYRRNRGKLVSLYVWKKDNKYDTALLKLQYSQYGIWSYRSTL